MEKKVKYLVVDSGAFIKHSPVHEYAENIYTVEGAVKEIKDKATRQKLQFLPYKLNIKEAHPDNYKHVMDFSKKTGDYGHLSATDLQVMALTYELEKEHVGTDHLNKAPSCKIVKKTSQEAEKLCGFYYPKKNKKSEDADGSSPESSDDRSDYETANDDSSVSDAENAGDDSDKAAGKGKSSVKMDDNGNALQRSSINALPERHSVPSDSESDEDSWISPNNITEVKRKLGHMVLDEHNPVTVACVTTDFCIQNVLIQMGLNVVSVDGISIKQTKIFILRCYGCGKLVNNVGKIFCPNCGYRTLKRVAVTVNDDGSKNVHINFRRPINIKGTRYSLPMPRGGKHSTDPVLCEDQPVPQNKPSKMALKKLDVMSPDYITMASPFSKNDVYSRASNLGINNKGRSQRRNPNEWNKHTGNKKRK